MIFNLYPFQGIVLTLNNKNERTMKRILFLLFIFVSALTVNAQQYYGRVSDPDGYTNIRSGPSTKYAIKRSFNSGDYLYYTPESNGWSKVYSGTSSSTFMGYMHTSRIKRVETSSPSSSVSSSSFKYGCVSDPDGYTNIRRGPSTSYAICRRYNSGDYLYYSPQSNGWSKVYSGTRSSTYMGYMHTSRIKEVNLSSSSSSSSSASSIPTSPYPSSSYMQKFFSYNNNRAYRVLLGVAHPSNTFKRGSVSVSGNNVYVTIYSSDSRHDNLYAKYLLKKDGAYFSSIECLEENDLVSSFTAADMLASLFNEILTTNETIKQVEGYFGSILSRMSAKTGCVALLSGLLWNYK